MDSPRPLAVPFIPTASGAWVATSDPLQPPFHLRLPASVDRNAMPLLRPLVTAFGLVCSETYGQLGSGICYQRHIFVLAPFTCPEIAKLPRRRQSCSIFR